VAGHQLYNNSTGTPVPYVNNIIPLSRLSPQALNLFKLLLANGKVPNTFTTDNGLTSNYSGTGTGIFNSDQWDVRGEGGVSQGANDSFAAGVDVAVNSRLVTDVRLGYFRYNILTHKNDP